jgi:Tfp pilus assembly protein PilF
VLLVLIPFLQVGWHEFIICDDNDYIYENPPVVDGLTAQGFWWAWQPHAGNWHPLTWLSHMTDCQVFGPREVDGSVGPKAVSGKSWPGGHHLVSVAIHATSTVLLFLALRMMTGVLWPSAMVAALFALHPLRAESVAWAAERKDVLSALFWMLTLLSYAWYARRPHILRYLLVLVSLGLGVMAKSMLVTLPCVLALMDYWPLQRWRPAGDLPKSLQPAAPFPRKGFDLLWVEKIPMLAIVLAVCWGAMHSQEAAGALNSWEGLPVNGRVANAFVSYLAYVGKIFWPTHLAIFYPHTAMIHVDRLFFVQTDPHIRLGFFFYGYVAGLLLLEITVAVLWLGRRRPYVIVGWLWYVGTLVPVIGLVQVGIQAMADRYTYIPSIGIFWLVVWGACEVGARWKISPWALRIEAAAVLLGCTTLTTIQVSYWRDSEALFKQAITAVPENYFGHLHLGKDYYQKSVLEGQAAHQAAAQGRTDQAAEHFEAMKDWRERAADQFRKSLEINRNYDFGNNNLGVCYADRGDQEGDAEAIRCFKTAVKIKMPYPDAHNNLCSVLSRQKRFKEAVYHGELAIKFRADQRSSDHVNLGLAYEGLERFSDAEEEYKIATKLDSHDVRPILCLVSVCLRQGKVDDANLWAQRLTGLDPHAAEMISNVQEIGRLLEAMKTETFDAGRYCRLAALYETLGNLAEARRWYRETLRLFPQSKNLDANGHVQLAVLQAKVGDLADAEKSVAKALEIDPNNGGARELLRRLRDARRAHPQ